MFDRAAPVLCAKLLSKQQRVAYLESPGKACPHSFFSVHTRTPKQKQACPAVGLSTHYDPHVHQLPACHSQAVAVDHSAEITRLRGKLQQAGDALHSSANQVRALQQHLAQRDQLIDRLRSKVEALEQDREADDDRERHRPAALDLVGEQADGLPSYKAGRRAPKVSHMLHQHLSISCCVNVTSA